MQQQRPIAAVMADHHHGAFRMIADHEPQGIGDAGTELLQRVPPGEPHERREPPPSAIFLRLLEPYLLVRPIGPGAVVEIVDVIEHATRDAAFIGDRLSGVDAALSRARISDGRLPESRDALCGELRFAQAALGQRKIRSPSKPCGLDPGNVAMSDQQDAPHRTERSPVSAALSWLTSALHPRCGNPAASHRAAYSWCRMR